MGGPDHHPLESAPGRHGAGFTGRRDNTVPQLKTAVDEDFEKIASTLPVGYELYWDGEYSDTVEAQAC